MSDSDGNSGSPSRLTVAAFTTVAVALIFGAALHLSTDVRDGRQQVQARADAHCKGREDCDKGSLQNDIRTADAAETAVDAGIWQLVFGGFGLIGLGYTVLYARSAWKESEKAAKAAIDALKHAREVSTAELRPWVTVTAKPTLVRFASDGVDFRYSLIFENLGSTVALNFCAFHHFLFESRRADKTIAEWLADMRSNIPEPNTVLMPGEVWEYPLRSPITDPIPWYNQINGRSTVIPVLAIVAFYRSGIDKEWKETHRTFQFAMANEETGVGGITKREGVWRAEELMAHNRGAVTAT